MTHKNPFDEQLENLRNQSILDEDIGVNISGTLLEKLSKYTEEELEMLFNKIMAKKEKKQAYPNYEYNMYISPQHDVQKWINLLKDIYYQEKNNGNRSQTIINATANWPEKEKYDFLNWLKFYESGSHMKYKFAQNYYVNDSVPGYSGYFVPFNKEQEKPATNLDVNNAKDPSAHELSDGEKKKIIQKQRKKIISRLDSAEKLLRTDEGELFAGKEFDSLLSSLYDLKKKIQMMNKVSISTTIYDDMIIREANILNKHGFIKAANILYSLAQDAGSDLSNPNETAPSAAPPAAPTGPAASPTADSTQSMGAPGNMPMDTPPGGMPTDATSGDGAVRPEIASNNPPSPKNMSEGMEAFLKGLDPAKESNGDELMVEDNDFNYIFDEGELLVTEAQVAETPAPSPATPLEVKEEVKPLETTPKSLEIKNPKSNFDAQFNQAFSNITVQDIIVKLEDLSKIFKTREVPRQLGLVDMMLDSLGLAPFFPALSEATNKALESNNYISTRVEEVLSKLRGTLATHEIDLMGDTEETKPEVTGLKNKLISEEEKEKAKKELKKQKEDELLEVSEKETPEIEIAEDLTEAPATPPPQPPAPAPAPTSTAAPPVA